MATMLYYSSRSRDECEHDPNGSPLLIQGPNKSHSRSLGITVKGIKGSSRFPEEQGCSSYLVMLMLMGQMHKVIL